MKDERRILPCLDVDQGRVVKGKKFKNIQDIADPLELARKYSEQGADELVFYDISATNENRNIFYDLIQAIKQEINIPFTVGGGIRTLHDIDRLFALGVDKVSINSAALSNPNLLTEGAEKYGAERIVLSVDVKEVGPEKWSVFRRGGREDTGLDALQWIQEGEKRGAGEVVVNSMDTDGVKDGYNLALMKAVRATVDIPVVASGGAGNMEHFQEVFEKCSVSGALAASVFHYDEINIRELKQYLKEPKE